MTQTHKSDILAKRTLLYASATMGFAQTVLFAILAPLGREVGLAEVQIGAIISCSSLTLFLVSPLWGRMSDVWGRRKVLLFGLFGYSFGTIIFSAVFEFALLGYFVPLTALILLIVTRVANAVAMAAVTPSSNAYMADITREEDRVKGMGGIGAAYNIGSILGPAIGGLLASITLLTPLYFSVFLTFSAALLTLQRLPERPISDGVRNNPKLKYTDPRVFPVVVAGFFLFMGFAIVQQTIAFRFQDVFGLDGVETAEIVGISLMFSAATALFVQMLIIPRISIAPFTLLRLAMPIMITAFATLALSSTQALYLLAMSVLGVGMGFAGPGFMAAASLAVSTKEQGAVAGLAGACPALGFTVGPLLGTYLYSIDGALPYWFALWCYLALLVITFKFKSKRTNPKQA